MDMEPQEQACAWQEEAGLLGRQSLHHNNNPNGTEEEENGHNQSVYFETHQGNGSAHEFSGLKFNATDSSVSEASSTVEELDLKTNNFPSTETNLEYGKHLANESFSGLSPVSAHRLHDQNIKNLEDLQNTAEGDGVADVIEEFDNEFTDLDVERVLQKQNTHDLYCPNCNSCITRKIVLCRRKLRVRNIRPKQKPGYKLETPSELDPSLAYPANYQGPGKLDVSPNGTPTPPANDRQLNVSPNDIPTPPATDHNNDRQLNVSPTGTPTLPADDHNTEIFRCLSCFSLFTPTGNGCKLFRCFGSSDENVNTEDVQNRPAPMKNWFFKIFSAGDDVIIDVEPQLAEPQPVQPHPVQTKPVQIQPVQTQPVQTHLVQTQPVHTQPIIPVDACNWDILKSIVYGGLIESIASLGVVSSAAGADATTLNILALGLASVVGGLFIIADNLRELKKDHSDETNEQEEDRYRRLLGQRQNFARHAIVVFVSFIVFGLVPPVIYGFSFRKSDDRDLKIAAVAGSSLACIVLLAIAKGHVLKPPRSYFTTVLYYVSLGVAVSGVSYVVGDLFEKLMEKLALFARENMEEHRAFLVE